MTTLAVVIGGKLATGIDDHERGLHAGKARTNKDSEMIHGH
ncbi:MAG TPA: hypothetical protein VLJ17_21780 [Xanthobacteraceae bacterium]|nr:hypothetical protein [Xanthobacteraceae bacterium]